jgi:hypothetical protein
VQWVNRPDPEFRGYAGLIASGEVKPGDRVRVLPSGRESHVARIVAMPDDLVLARAGQAVTLTLTDEIDVSRGDVIAAADAPLQVADQFESSIVWMDDEPLPPGRTYLLKIGARTATAQVTAIKHRINVNTLEKLAAKRLELNDIAVCNLSLDRPIAFEPYEANRDLGGFIRVRSVPDRGSVFHLHLPVHTPEAADAAWPAAFRRWRMTRYRIKAIKQILAGANALGQPVEHRRNLDLGLEHLEASLNIGQALVSLDDLSGGQIRHIGHQQ